jgi:hypothetical protein
MRCKGCGYSLWNVPGRTCPECGRRFAPSEFEFRPNTVEFCCPGCMQQYYGTDKDGLPVPREFACVRCAAACSLDTMVLRLAPGATDDETEVARVPWERPGHGVMSRFFATVRDGLSAPMTVGRAVAAGADGWAASRYALAVLTVAALPTGLAVLGFVAFFEGIGATGARTGAAAWRSSVVSVVGSVLAATMGSVLGVMLMVLAMAGLATLTLRVLGRAVPWRVVWPAYAYSLAPMILVSVPCLGPYCVTWVAAVWVVVAATVALLAAVPGSAGRVVTATIVPVAAAVLLVAGSVAWVVVPLVNAATAPMPAAAAASGAETASADAEGDEPASAGDGDAMPTAEESSP